MREDALKTELEELTNQMNLDTMVQNNMEFMYGHEIDKAKRKIQEWTVRYDNDLENAEVAVQMTRLALQKYKDDFKFYQEQEEMYKRRIAEERALMATEAKIRQDKQVGISKILRLLHHKHILYSISGKGYPASCGCGGDREGYRGCLQATSTKEGQKESSQVLGLINIRQTYLCWQPKQRNNQPNSLGHELSPERVVLQAFKVTVDGIGIREPGHLLNWSGWRVGGVGVAPKLRSNIYHIHYFCWRRQMKLRENDSGVGPPFGKLQF